MFKELKKKKLKYENDVSPNINKKLEIILKKESNKFWKSRITEMKYSLEEFKQIWAGRRKKKKINEPEDQSIKGRQLRKWKKKIKKNYNDPWDLWDTTTVPTCA